MQNRDRRYQREASSSFHSPSNAENQTDYNLDYTSRISNPFERTQTRAYARKSTSRGPYASKRHATTSSPSARSAAQSVSQEHRRKRPPLSMRQRERRMQNEIRKLQLRIKPLIPKLCFARLVRQILSTLSPEIKFVTREAFGGLQEATEMYLTQQLSDAYLLTLHRGRVTLHPRDMELLRELRQYCRH